MPKIKHISVKSLRNKLDKLCSLVVRGRGRCEHCGSRNQLQTAHIFSRTYNATRWLLENLLCLCASCHWFFHKNPILFAEWVREYLGEKRYESLKVIRNGITKFTISELELLILKYTHLLTTLGER